MASADYAKKKNADLEELLKARGLPHTGKKADLVARLQEDDAAKASGAAPGAAPSAASTSAAPAAEDEIDWDDSTAATSKPAADALAAGGTGRVANPVAVPNQVQAEDPAKEDLVVKQPDAAGSAAAAAAAGASAAGTDAPQKDFGAGLGSTSVTAELEKRKARAARFGLAEESEAVDKELARAKRFGVDSETSGDKRVGALDYALPEREQRRKRGRGPEVSGRDGKRRDSRRRDGRGGGGGGGDRDRERERGKQSAAAGQPMSDAERLKVEARAKRFAAAS